MTNVQLWWNEDGKGSYVSKFWENMGGLGAGCHKDIAAADLTGDGVDDFVVSDHGVNLYRNNGEGGFLYKKLKWEPSYRGTIRLVDLDGDEDLDIAWAYSEYVEKPLLSKTSVSFGMNDGEGNFDFSDANLIEKPLSPSAITSMEFADVDKDGDKDLFLSCENEKPAIWLNDGTGDFGYGPANSFGSKSTEFIVVGDLDGNEYPDVLAVNHKAGSVQVILNDISCGDMCTKWTLDFGSVNAMVLGDVDQDGDLDIVFNNSWGIFVSYNTDGKGHFGAKQYISGSSEDSHLALADVDGDLDLDLLVAPDGPVNQWQPHSMRMYLYWK